MKTLKQFMLESDNPFKKSKVGQIVYRCGEALEAEKFSEVIWFSDRPITRFGKMSKYYIDIQHPFVVKANGNSWSDKLWLMCCDSEGKPNKSPRDKKLLDMIPSPELWKMVQESDEEYEYGDIPYLVAKHMRNKYDSVILEDIYETEACDIEVTDYCVFSMDQVAQTQ